MTNKSGDLGRRAETAVARYLAANGWPHAEVRSKRGRFDPGDITGTPGICWEVKGGHAAEDAAPDKRAVEIWRDETDVEQRNTGADLGVLVCKRKGRSYHLDGVARWEAHVRLSALCELKTGFVQAQFDQERPTPDPWVRLVLSDLTAMLRAAGYGNPLPPTSEDTPHA